MHSPDKSGFEDGQNTLQITYNLLKRQDENPAKKKMNESFEISAKPEQLNPPQGRRIKVAVLTGGPGREREVSIESGKCVADALELAGVNVIVADIKPDHLEILDDRSVDVFFIAIHGTFGEDGTLQEILESKNLVYTGSPPKASRLAFDKWLSKDLFSSVGAPTPDAILFDAKDAQIEDRIRRLGQKYVIKPLREGSTIGITIADTPAQAAADAKKCTAEFGDCMIEKFIPGKELTVSVIGNLALPILEIRPQSGIYDYHAKYIDDKTQYLFDTITGPGVANRIQQFAVDCFNVLGCRGAARVDFILGDDGKPYVLEINTIPGMTTHSLLPKAAAKMGIPMDQLCLMMVEMAQADAADRHPVRERR
jgi:D-alanine-D-alanine ligase